MQSRKGNVQLTNWLRTLARVTLILVALVAMVGIAAVGIQKVLNQGSTAGQKTMAMVPLRTPTPPEEPQPPKDLRQWLLGAYLSLRKGDINKPVNPQNTNKVTFTISPGETAGTIGPRLEQMGLIVDADLFSALVRYRGIDNRLEVGEYRLSPSMSMEQIVIELQHGRVKTVTLTIPEGWRMEQVANALAQAGLGTVDEFLALMRKDDYPYPWLKDRPEGAPAGLEGFLLPDTYIIPVDAKPVAVIDLILRNFDSQVTPELRKAMASHDLSFYEAVTLAALVEREAVSPEERPLIAGVFYHRLDKGMWLQADPTVSYAKGFDAATDRWWTPMLMEEAQTVESPYNTFLNPGLTPGPICSPGLAALQAVADPTQTTFLYFMAKGDGTHAFAESYEEHLLNVQKYQPQ